MADGSQLEILSQSIETWNQLRDEKPEVLPDLFEAHLVGMNLRLINLKRAELFRANLSNSDLFGSDLSKAVLCEASLENTKLRGADLRDADLSRASLHRADLRDANLSRANLFYTELPGARLRHANLSNAMLRGANLKGCDLCGANLKDANLGYSDLSGTDLRGAILTRAQLRGSDLSNAKLGGINMAHADLLGANLRSSDLSGANLSSVNLSRADLTDTRLNVANLKGANLRNAILEYADLGGADLAGADLQGIQIGFTQFGNVDLSLSTVKGLELAVHRGPSTIGIDTIYRSKGNIPEVFLRGAGVADDMIIYIQSLLGQPNQLDSCFISYSNRDEAFSKMLYSRLRESNIRVWYAPEDVKGGEKLNDQISKAIQIYGRVLIVLSENSLQSEWVIEEIRKARRAEARELRRKLFPIRLVDFETIKLWKCVDADSGKDLAREVREYFIPDFSNWKTPEAFEVSFKRLLRDLKADDNLQIAPKS